jgi:hypothetical protein
MQMVIQSPNLHTRVFQTEILSVDDVPQSSFFCTTSWQFKQQQNIGSNDGTKGRIAEDDC